VVVQRRPVAAAGFLVDSGWTGGKKFGIDLDGLHSFEKKI